MKDEKKDKREEKEERDTRGRDLFFGIIAVATLFIAIVGATLAYFSLMTSSNEGAVNARAAIEGIVYNDGQQVTAAAENLIPSSFDVVKTVYERNIKDADSDELTASNLCIDDNSREVCSAYRFSVSSEVERSFKTTLYTVKNEFTYLGYAVYDVTNQKWLELDSEGSTTIALTKCSNEEDASSEAITDCYSLNGDTKVFDSLATNSVFGLNDQNEFVAKTISTTEQVYDIVLYIRENNANQNIDQGKEFSGTIMVEATDTTGGNGQITGYVK